MALGNDRVTAGMQPPATRSWLARISLVASVTGALVAVVGLFWLRSLLSAGV